MGVGYRKERRGGSAQEEAVMASMMEDSRVLGFLFGTDEMRAVWSEKNWVQKWLDTEAALARAQGELGVIPRETADVIVSHARAEEIDMDALAEGFRSSITIVPLLNAFKKSLPGDAGEYVHWGATSRISMTRASSSWRGKRAPSSCAMRRPVFPRSLRS